MNPFLALCTSRGQQRQRDFNRRAQPTQGWNNYKTREFVNAWMCLELVQQISTFC